MPRISGLPTWTRVLAFPVLFLLLLLGGWQCAARLKAAAAAALMGDVVAAANQQGDVDLVMQATPAYLLVLEGLRQADPGNGQLLGALTQAYTSYAILVELGDPERAARLYHRAKTYGLQGMRLEKRLAPLVDAPFPIFAQIRGALKPRDLEQVFWTAFSWGAWINSRADSMAALAQLPKVILLMEWAAEQDETYLYASPHVFLGVYHASIPVALGGDPGKALFHFDRARELTQGRALMVQVQKARYYARQIFDRQLYVDLLTAALTLPADADPELALQNAAARRMARKLLEETDAFF